MKLVITEGCGKVVKHLNPKTMRRLKKMLKTYGEPIPKDIDYALIQVIFFNRKNFYADVHISKKGKIRFQQTVQTIY